MLVLLRQSRTGAATVATCEMGDAFSMVVIWEELTGLPVYEKLQLPSDDSGMSPVMLLLVRRFEGHT